ncbi:Spy/CpxP family protein refolding chaperone [Phycisphaerales bacterium AB-hyl4]|uniref:Spy/CpxP family protein refolding chaperone n=1 Tax=Natronomicrosphaera hydrolytica TaxID=3242702 RepID=A0ABV4U8D3_9BACT
MKRFTTLGAWLAVLMLTIGGGAAVADDNDNNQDRDRSGIQMRHPATGMHGMDEGSLRRLVRDLDLDDEQHEQIRETLREARERRMSWWQEHGQAVHGLRQRVHNARKADDREQFRESWAELGELMFDAPDPGQVIHDVKEILTEEQREQLEANWQEARERMERRRERRGGRRDRDGNGDDENGDDDNND